MSKYFLREAEEDIQMDVQVGPKEEIEAEVEQNPVDLVKKTPESVPVAAVEKEDGVYEFYVDAKDVERFADLNEMSMVDALNAIIECHYDAPIDATNMVVMMDESTKCYARTLEKNGAACIIREAADEEAQQDDIEIDVQVGPNEDEMSVKADPQEANPVDAVKRQYDNVIVAKQGDEFFMDVEDVQKCAELNCESVIDTLNNIIDVNEAEGMSADNIVLVMGEGVTEATLEELKECGIDFF